MEREEIIVQNFGDWNVLAKKNFKLVTVFIDIKSIGSTGAL